MRKLSPSPNGEALVIGTTDDITTVLNGPIRPGRILINTQTEIVGVQLPNGTLKVLETVSRPTHPDAINKPSIVGVTQAPNGYSVLLHASGSTQTFISPQTDIGYYWYMNTYDLVHVGDSFSFEIKGQIGDVIRVGCRAIDDFSNTSEITWHDITIGDLLVVRPFMTDLPATGIHGQTGTFYIDPGTDVYGNPYTAVVHSSVGLTITGVTTFDVTTWMTYTVTNDVSFGGDTNNQVELQLGGVTIVNEVVSMNISEPAGNQPPLIGKLVTTFPSLAYSNETGTFRVSGAVDPEGQSVFYTVLTNDSNLTLSNNINVVDTTDINYHINKDPSLPVYDVAIHVVASDIYGKASSAKSFTCTVHTDKGLVFDYDQFAHDLGAQEDTVTPTDHKYGGMTVTVDGTEYPLSYTINSPDITPHSVPNVVGKWSWLAAGQKTVTWTPYIGDLVGNGISVQIKVITSYQPPNLGNLTGIPTEMNINFKGTYQLTGGVDPEGGTLSYVVTPQSCITYSGSNTVANNENFQLTSGSTLGLCNVAVVATSSKSGVSTTKVFPVNIVNKWPAPDLSNVTGVPTSVAINIGYSGTYDGAIDPAGGTLSLVWSTGSKGALTTTPTANNQPIGYLGTTLGATDITLTATSDVSLLSTTRIFQVTVLNATLSNAGMSIVTPISVASANMPQSVSISYTGTLTLVNFELTATPSTVNIVKKTGLANNEVTTYTVTGGYSTNIVFSAKGFDATGASTIPLTKNVRYNDGPNVSGMNLILTDPLTEKDSYNASITAATDVNSNDSLTYKITSNNKVLVPTTAITPTVNFKVDALVAGAASLVVHVSDPYVTVDKTFARSVISGSNLSNAGMVINHMVNATSSDMPASLSVSYTGSLPIDHWDIEVTGNTGVSTAIATLALGASTTTTLTSGAPWTRDFTVRARGVLANGNTTSYLTKNIAFNDTPSVASASFASATSGAYEVNNSYVWNITGVTDNNSDELTWEAQVTGGNAAISTGGGTNTRAQVTITPNAVGAINFRVRASDGRGVSDWKTGQMTAVVGNSPPGNLSISAPAWVWSDYDFTWTHNAAQDPDGDPISYTYSTNTAFNTVTNGNSPGPNQSITTRSKVFGSGSTGNLKVTAADNKGGSTFVQKYVPVLNSAILPGEFYISLTVTVPCASFVVSVNARSGTDTNKLKHWYIHSITYTPQGGSSQSNWYQLDTTTKLYGDSITTQPNAGNCQGVSGLLEVTVRFVSINISGSYHDKSTSIGLKGATLKQPTAWRIDNGFTNPHASPSVQYFTQVDYTHLIPTAQPGASTSNLSVEVTACNEANLIGTYTLNGSHSQNRSALPISDSVLSITYRLINTSSGELGPTRTTTFPMWEDDQTGQYTFKNTAQYGSNAWRLSIYNGSSFSTTQTSAYPWKTLRNNDYDNRNSALPNSAWELRVYGRSFFGFEADSRWSSPSPMVGTHTVTNSRNLKPPNREVRGEYSSKEIELHAAPHFVYPPSSVYTHHVDTGFAIASIDMPTVAWVMIEVPHSLFKWYNLRIRFNNSSWYPTTNSTTYSGGHARVLFRLTHNFNNVDKDIQLQAKRLSSSSWVTTDEIYTNCKQFTASSTLDWGDVYTTYNPVLGTITQTIGYDHAQLESNSTEKYFAWIEKYHMVRGTTLTHLISMVRQHYSCDLREIECNGVKPVLSSGGVWTWSIIQTNTWDLNFKVLATGTGINFHRHTIIDLSDLGPHVTSTPSNSVHNKRGTTGVDLWAPVISYWAGALHSAYPDDTSLSFTTPATSSMIAADVFCQNGVESVICRLVIESS
jgi:hypothetical protein